MGRAPSVSPEGPRLVFCSIYNEALRLSGNAGKVDAISAPFWTSISAIGNAVTLADDSDRVVEAPGEGAAGSAAASAKNTECVPLDLSRTFGLALSASA